MSLRYFPILPLLFILASCTGLEARKVALRLKVPQTQLKDDANIQRGEELDSTAMAVVADSIRFAGFEKNASSTVESFFVTNN